VVETEQDRSFRNGLYGEDAEIDHVGVVGPNQDAGDHQDGDPLDGTHAATAEAAVGGHAPPHHDPMNNLDRLCERPTADLKWSRQATQGSPEERRGEAARGLTTELTLTFFF